MKKLLLLSVAFIGFLTFSTSCVNAQGVGINSSGNSPDPSAGLDVNFTNKGTLITRMTSAQRDAISSPANGLLIYNTDCQNINLFTTNGWLSISNAILPSTAGTITGTATICQGQSNVSYSVPSIANASSYTWIYSGTGATISGTTNSIAINFSASATSGNLTVTGSNPCGNGTTSANFAVTVGPMPAAPTSGSHSATQAQITWSWSAVSGATGYKWGTTNDYNAATNNGPSTSFTQSGLTCGTSYTLYVWAYAGCGPSSYTMLTQSTSNCCSPSVILDAASQVTANTGPSSFSITTNYADEILLVGLNGYGSLFDGTISISNAGTVTKVAEVFGGNPGAAITIYACVAPSGSHTINITWGTWYSSWCMAYAASFTGFCNTPSVAANVHSQTYISSNSNTISGTITPATSAYSSLFADYYNYTGQSQGVLTWTTETPIRADYQPNGGTNGFDGSIANTQTSSTSPVTVTVTDTKSSNCANCAALVLTDIHP